MTEERGGFSYKFSTEKLIRWKSIPAEKKLEWLEEANAFLQKAMTKEKRKIMEAFRKGEFRSSGKTRAKVRRGGQWQRKIRIANDFDELPQDIADAFGLGSKPKK